MNTMSEFGTVELNGDVNLLIQTVPAAQRNPRNARITLQAGRQKIYVSIPFGSEVYVVRTMSGSTIIDSRPSA